MDWLDFHNALLIIQRTISFLGVLIILSGVLYAIVQYVQNFFVAHKTHRELNFNAIRLTLGRVLLLGLEFIVAADLIGTTTAPDYYSVGILAGIVVIRTLLTWSLNKEMSSLTKEQKAVKA